MTLPVALDGALLIDKPVGISSFNVVEQLQRSLQEKTGIRRRELPKIGHGGTLDPFASGLLIVCVGKGVKLSRYFLGSEKTYSATLRFGETTIPGDHTAEISERCEVLPSSLAAIQAAASDLAAHPYAQIPPMHSAKKVDGRPLYELARQGIEIERQAKVCHLSNFNVLSFESPRAKVEVSCTAGTYIRVLAQDLAKKLGSLALLDELRRIKSGAFHLEQTCTLPQILEASPNWPTLNCWVPFDRLLDKFPSIEASRQDMLDLCHGKQACLSKILERAPSTSESHLAVFYSHGNHRSLIAVFSREGAKATGWELERVFPPENQSANA